MYFSKQKKRALIPKYAIAPAQRPRLLFTHRNTP